MCIRDRSTWGYYQLQVKRFDKNTFQRTTSTNFPSSSPTHLMSLFNNSALNNFISNPPPVGPQVPGITFNPPPTRLADDQTGIQKLLGIKPTGGLAAASFTSPLFHALKANGTGSFLHKYEPTKTRDNYSVACITAQPYYEDLCLEEVRIEDYSLLASGMIPDEVKKQILEGTFVPGESKALAGLAEAVALKRKTAEGESAKPPEQLSQTQPQSLFGGMGSAPATGKTGLFGPLTSATPTGPGIIGGLFGNATNNPSNSGSTEQGGGGLMLGRRKRE
eukprot:TRINITY_DN7516_c0_g1_i3.p1 TRINITY_DN7516_c0_g1~~TRINITY_DN7516_c0_g1_i3.p1  ORF type:complete len:317 (+),score=37.75 TRINITY_DN7516_c0_g1_i3:122-952(+)